MKKDYQIIIGLAVSGLLLLFLGRFFSFLIIIATILITASILFSAIKWQQKLFKQITGEESPEEALRKEE